jgi:hypothetical protein
MRVDTFHDLLLACLLMLRTNISVISATLRMAAPTLSATGLSMRENLASKRLEYALESFFVCCLCCFVAYYYWVVSQFRSFSFSILPSLIQ